ncbi:hypothetical protein MEE_01478 [Bartonella elizabethae F9251 = ATCC 49927]|uniref:Uncharacterized protein n=1 Tax=Bartonella elizabethae F9251 = ATCC 49927 TaxID=1094555 RepID=J1K742_BAREL|nr:hypothetical protein MEE_01478 [Bartonella elizabethae F9251 = ATCC 49927]VEJ41859.1 Uncharacterised protein [Bartonella elizabethae]
MFQNHKQNNPEHNNRHPNNTHPNNRQSSHHKTHHHPPYCSHHNSPCPTRFIFSTQRNTTPAPLSPFSCQAHTLPHHPPAKAPLPTQANKPQCSRVRRIKQRANPSNNTRKPLPLLLSRTRLAPPPLGKGSTSHTSKQTAALLF